MPRSINTLPLTSRVMMMHLCSECQYCDAEHPVVGTLHVGEIVTSRNALSTLLDLSVQEVRTALAWLESNGYISVEATARYTKITVLWQDFLSLNGLEIILNNQVSNQVNNQVSNQVSNQVLTSVTAENTSSCEDEKILLTKSSTNNNIKYIENNITHTSNSKYLVETKSAPARETPAHTSDTHEQVQELARYIAQKAPQFQAMEEPFTIEDLTAIVEEHSRSLDDAKAILLQAKSRRAYLRDDSAIEVFKKYAKGYYAYPYHPQATPTENSRLLTFSEMLAEFNKIGYGTTDDHFVVADVLGADGKKRWVRIS